MTENDTCRWEYDDWFLSYDTSCGDVFCFVEDEIEVKRLSKEIEANEFRYCPYCGRKIKEVTESEAQK